MKLQQTTTKTSQPQPSKNAPRNAPPVLQKYGACHPILQLQRTFGNRAVGQLIQAKLSVGQPDDQYEQEADRVADQVMRMPVASGGEEDEEQMVQTKPLAVQVSPLVQRQLGEEEEESLQADEEEMVQAKPLAEHITPLVQRQADEEEEEPLQAKALSSAPYLQRKCPACESGGATCPKCAEEEKLQRQPLAATITPFIQRQTEMPEEEETLQTKTTSPHAPQVTPKISANLNAMRGNGQSLPASARAFFEPRFGVDFSGVRVHTNGRAAETSRAVNARAFTVGRDVAFGSGQYAPESSEGRKLLAHELTHVVQQENGNRIKRMDGKADAPAGDKKPVLGPEIEQKMDDHVQQIKEKLKEQILEASEEREIVGLVEYWANMDANHRRLSGYQGADYLDKFLFKLKLKVFPRRTARTAWLAEQWVNAYDLLWHELEEERLAQFKTIVATSKKEATTGPREQQEESVWSYVGKREAMGVVGILKAMGLAVSGVVDTAIWTAWKNSGASFRDVLKMAGVKDPEKAPQISAYIDKSFDETAEIFAQQMGIDLNEELFGGMSAYGFASTAGKVPAALMLGGALAKAGAAGQALGIAQAGQQAEGLYDTVKKLRESGKSWSEIAKNPEIWLQVVGVVSSAIGSASSFAEAHSLAKQVFKNLNAIANATQVSVMVAAYLTIDDDPKISVEEKTKRKAELLADMVSTTALMINDRYSESFEKAWKRRFEQETGLAKLPENAPAPIETTTGKSIETQPGKVEAPTTTAEAPAAKPKAQGEAPEPIKPSIVGGGIDDIIKSLEGSETGGFKAEGPVVAVPVHKEGKPARVLEVGAGPTETELGIPRDKALVDVKPTDINPRPSAEFLDATKPVPPHLVGQFETVLINNPRGYVPNLSELALALRPGGRIIVQGKAEVTPGQRGINPDFNKLFQDAVQQKAPPGLKIVETLSIPGAATGTPTMENKPIDIMGGPFQRTTGGPVGWPNARIIYEKLP